MSLLDRILGRKSSDPPDPTADWPDPPNVGLILVPHEGRLGDLKFGDPIHHARSFGKPTAIRWIQNDYCELLYARAGMQIDFDGGRFAYMAFFMNRHVAEPGIAGGFDPALVNLQLASGWTGQLSRKTKRDVIEGCFGNPSQIDADDNETILTYEFAGITLEFEMHPDEGTVMRLNLYPSAQD